jgi:hypothetical protein
MADQLSAPMPLHLPGSLRQPSCARCEHVFREGPNLKCRRYPPTLHVLLVPKPPPALDAGRPVIQHIVDFVPVQPTMRCGEYKPTLAESDS